MHVIEYAQYGGPEVLQLMERPAPSAGPGEVRVRLLAAGISPIDVKLRAGLLRAHFALQFPKIPGRDGVGVIDQIGAGVTGLALNDAVCVAADPAGAGTYADAIVCDAARVVRRPAGLNDVQAAALLQPGISAWISVVETARISSGMRVLVHGGSGAVGGLMVQLASYLGAHVTATCRAANLDYVRSLGAEHAIAYDRDDFGTLRDQDVVFDLMGGDVHARSYPVLRRGGHLVYLVAQPFVDQGDAFGVHVSRAMIVESPKVLQAVAQLAEQGVLQPQVAGVYALADAAMAQRALEQGEVTRGRLVLVTRASDVV